MNEIEKKLDDILQHHGVKGMKWGVRKSEVPNTNTSKWDSEHVKLTDYKGKTYFISEHNMDGKTLIPRTPKNYFTKNGFEDDKTNRVSFAPSVDNALMGLSQNVSGKKFYVHEPVGHHDVYKPNVKAVPDSNITGELWIKDPVKLRTVGEVFVTGDSGKQGKQFKYGDNVAELYEFDYEWTVRNEVKHMDDLEQLLLQSGIKGMKWGVRHEKRRKIANEKIHNRNKDRKLYKKLYNKNLEKTKGNHDAAVTKTRKDIIKRRNAAILATVVTIKVAQAAAKNPEVIRFGKNIVLSLKNSPVRHVDGRRFKDAINI